MKSSRCAQLLVVIVMVAANRSFFDRAVHRLDLLIRPGMARLGTAELHISAVAGRLEAVGAEDFAGGDRLLDG